MFSKQKEMKEMKEQVIRDMFEPDLARHIVGRSIRFVDDATLTLDDGTQLEFEDEASCCAYFNANVETFDFKDNVVTGVDRVELEGGDTDAFKLNILSNHKLIATVNVDGNATSGYYCHSVTLIVRTPS